MSITNVGHEELTCIVVLKHFVINVGEYVNIKVETMEVEFIMECDNYN